MPTGEREALLTSVMCEKDKFPFWSFHGLLSEHNKYLTEEDLLSFLNYMRSGQNKLYSIWRL
jgi:hypothetical protein